MRPAPRILKYKYDIQIGKKIVEIVGKEKDGITAYKLRKEVEKSQPRGPSHDKISATQYQLETWQLLKRKDNGKTKLYLTNLMMLLLQFNYEPHHIIKFLKISQAICVGSLIGTRYVKDRIDGVQRGDFLGGSGLIADNIKQTDFSKTKILYDFKRLGISKEEIIEKRFRNPTNYQDLEFTSEEIDDYLKLLTDLGLIISETDNMKCIRYIIHPKVEQFYVDWWIAFFNEISFRFYILSNSPRSLTGEEKNWYKTHYGEQNYNDIFNSNKYYKSIEEKRRLKKGITEREAHKLEKEQKEYRDRRLEEAKDNAIFLYGFLTKKYKDTVIGIPGLKELIIDFICPKGLLKIIERSKNEMD
jgi:hypothetical protein